MAVKQNKRGFTLLEMALVLLLTGLLGAVVVPSIKNVRRQELRQIANELCLDLVQVRKMSKANAKAEYVLELQVDAQSGNTYGYTIKEVTGNTPPYEVLQHKNKNREIIQINIFNDSRGGLISGNNLSFKAGEVYDGNLTFIPSKQYNSPLKIELEGHDMKAVIEFAFDTGHYTLVM